jgi:hypothetical protein
MVDCLCKTFVDRHLQFKFKHISNDNKMHLPKHLGGKVLTKGKCDQIGLWNVGVVGLMYCTQSGETQRTFCDTFLKSLNT